MCHIMNLVNFNKSKESAYQGKYTSVFAIFPISSVAQLVERRTLDLLVQVKVDLKGSEGQIFFFFFWCVMAFNGYRWLKYVL